MTDLEQNALELAEEALENGYDPFARAADRGYPSAQVTVYWDEVAARALVEHDKKLSQKANRVATFQAAIARAPEVRKAAEGDKKVLSDIQKAVQEDTAKLEQEQAEFDAMEAEGQLLKVEVEKSGVTFGLRGFSTEVTDAIHEKVSALHPAINGEQNPEWAKRYTAEIISSAIEWVQPFGEDKNTTPISAKVVLGWRKTLPEESYIKLNNAVGSVTLATGFFKSLEDAGFLARS